MNIVGRLHMHVICNDSVKLLLIIAMNVCSKASVSVFGRAWIVLALRYVWFIFLIYIPIEENWNHYMKMYDW